MRTKPIQSHVMFRNILGKVGDYRGFRILPIEGTIVGTPHVPLDYYQTRNLLSMALDFDSDGRASCRVHISNAAAQSAFDPTQAALSQENYTNTTFVTVRPQGGNVNGEDDVVCVHLIEVAACADFDGKDLMSYVYDHGEPSDIVISDITWGEAEIVTVKDDKDYELTEDVHYSVTDTSFTLLEAYLEYAFDEPVDAPVDCREITISLDKGCEPIVITVCSDTAEGENGEEGEL